MNDARITFNQPALRHLFKHDDPTGVRVSVKVENGDVFIKPSWYDSKAAELLPRGNFGKQIVLEDDALEILSRQNIDAHPYFILKHDSLGWLKLEHVEEVPKTVPHIRLWTTGGDSKLPENLTGMIHQFVSTVKRSQELVSSFSRKKGRPPLHIQEAKNILSKFETIYRSSISD